MKRAIGAITVGGWSSSAGSEANPCRRVVDGADIRPPIDPDEAYRPQYQARRDGHFAEEHYWRRYRQGLGSKSADRDGNCHRPVGLITSGGVMTFCRRDIVSREDVGDDDEGVAIIGGALRSCEHSFLPQARIPHA